MRFPNRKAYISKRTVDAIERIIAVTVTLISSKPFAPCLLAVVVELTRILMCSRLGERGDS